MAAKTTSSADLHLVDYYSAESLIHGNWFCGSRNEHRFGRNRECSASFRPARLIPDNLPTSDLKEGLEPRVELRAEPEAVGLFAEPGLLLVGLPN